MVFYQMVYIVDKKSDSMSAATAYFHIEIYANQEIEDYLIYKIDDNHKNLQFSQFPFKKAIADWKDKEEDGVCKYTSEFLKYGYKLMK